MSAVSDVTKRSGEDAIDPSKAPLLDHLVELRKRLIWSLVAVGARQTQSRAGAGECKR